MSSFAENEGDEAGGKEATKPPSPKPDTGTPPGIKPDGDQGSTNEEAATPTIPTTVYGAPTQRSQRRRVKDQVNTGRKRLATFTQQAHAHTATTTTPGNKKNMVLSGDAMKEMARQAKATREERRSGLDGRHKYIIAKVADAIGVEDSVVEDQIVGDDHFDLIDYFFEPNGARKLMFYYQDAAPRESAYSRADVASVIPSVSTKKLFLTNGDGEALIGICYFFVRTITKPITTANIANEVNFGMIDSTEGGLLKGIETLLGKIMIPALRVQENWGALSEEENNKSPVVDEFIESVEKFVNVVSTARISLEGKFELEEIDVGYNLDSFRAPADYIQASRNSDLVEKLEGVVEAWCRQIDQVLAESEQMRKEADDIGPAAELEHWRQRMSKFNALLDEIKTPRVKTVVGVVHAAKSRCIRHWVTLDSRITDAANEAKDNVKYLYTLDKYFGPLSKCDPRNMVEIIPSLMNSIRMIHSISQYYNTSERMTSLFVKVTNQMITTCKLYINHGAAKIWDQDRMTLLRKMEDCQVLNQEYQKAFHKIKEKLKENPNERQFEFSENYIFGKFDTFCRRLDKLTEMFRVMHEFSGIHNVKIEGIDSIALKYQNIVTNTEKKKYDVLDHRKAEFDSDYNDFCNQIEGLQQTLQDFLDTWFSKPLTTEYMLILVEKFENIKGAKLYTFDKYMALLARYSKDLDNVKKAYQKMKTDPPIPRNLPPISGKIAWARQMYRRIEVPIEHFRKHPDVLATVEGKKVVSNFNKLAAVLLEFEVLYHKAWCKATELAKTSLQSSLLIRHPETKSLLVNLDPSIFEILCEAKHLRKIGMDIPDAVYTLCLKEEKLHQDQRKLQETLDEFESIKEGIPSIIQPCLKPLIGRVEETILPGLTMLTWASMNFDKFIANVCSSLEDLKIFTKKVSDVLECRIEVVTEDMGMTALCDLPEDEPVTPEEFVQRTDHIVELAAKSLCQQSVNVELAVFDLIKLFEDTLAPDEMAVLEAQGKGENFPNWYHGVMGALCQKNTDALVKCTRLTLDTIKRRLQQHSSKYQTMMSGSARTDEEKVPLFRSNIILAIPAVVMRPSLEEIQSSLNKATEIILRTAKNIPLWRHAEMQKWQQKLEAEAAKKIGEDPKMTKTQPQKPLYLQVSEHKDVVKVSGPLHTTITSLKSETDSVLETFASFSELWNSDPQDRVKEFEEDEPGFTEYEGQIRYYAKMEAMVEDIPLNYRVGAVTFETDQMRLALVEECKAWKRAFGGALNRKAGATMDDIYGFTDNLQKILSRPINDLDDVRTAMSSLKDIREAQIRIDMTIGPIEESYALLNRFELYYDDGNSERVDGLAYQWRNLMAQVNHVQNTLLEVQPGFKATLLSGVEKFQLDVGVFYKEYDNKGPNIQGLAPREASDRLQIFQTRFDELWRKYTTYSGGEELFGLTVTEYQDLQRIKRELTLLQKLYNLYNTVIENVNSYYDILWAELDIEKINSELLEFQNKCRKLPKALKEWEAYLDLKAKIDNFSECCPLLEMMSDKAMMPRHWERIEKITQCTFDVENENFQLRNIMEAPLLENKEDIEDICISAVKERDIEAKLKQVVNEWSIQVFTFSQFKTRGELLLKGSDLNDIVALMEDSLMVLGSLMSNRYNAPFKPTIQQWVHKLSGTTEIIENWLVVQNLWVYLEAVFVGGDIAKQLPQEAKRFANIDKSWLKIMQRAHETPNVVQCCMGDDTLAQLLPHILEQLEMCQKSLTGYLEKKRLVFPRFFFVSDPALLEILGQASDSHTIQAHLLGLFDNVYRVEFHEKNYDHILKVISQETEEVELIQPIVAQGNVEIWLGTLLQGIRQTVHSIVRRAANAISEAGFQLIDFENVFPAQVGILGLQMLWTRDSEDALTIAKSDKKAMQNANQRFIDMLKTLIDQTTLDLSSYERMKYETLITIHVHQRDIFDDLVKMHIKSPTDFEWLKQSRFYYIEDADKCQISITDVDFGYCNEYTGCNERLVITPLTDRCYITLAQALGMSLGGSPAGPAGTGKTETVKDMGKCLAKYVVVFNCSDQMDYRGLGRIYKGLAQSGSWGCFDEFNRIELPVLSVAAQQIAIVLQCKKMNKPQFVFTDGDNVSMDREFGIFLTMNPGYAGRQELPENLKINFRTVAMMVPDRAIIIRVKLAACGFLDNIILSKKFFTLYKLCEEQLSKQVHYDFGLRNILSVLRTLGAVKRQNPDDPEAMIVMRGLRDMNLSKLVDEDEPLFLSLINDLFPGIQLDKAGYPQLEAAIEKQVHAAGLIFHPSWVLKIIQLFETQRVRHGMMVLGPSGAGKTKCIYTLMKAMTDCGEPHREMRMNPKAITAPQMFGTLDVSTNDWTDGIFSTLWRRSHKAKKGEHIWLVLDGPVDTLWIENLNSVLDDNKTLTLANGDRIPMAPNCKIIFEPHNVDNASPATVSRNGMVFMSSSALDWRPICQGWLKTLPSQQSDIMWSLFESVFQDLYNFVTTKLVAKMEILECMYIRQTMDLLQGLLPNAEEKQVAKDYLTRIFIFSIMWSLGSLLELEYRELMEDFLRKHESKLDLPATTGEETIFEYVVGEKGEWEHWRNRVPIYKYPKDTVPEYTSILVPNVDNIRTEFLMHTIMKQEKSVLLIGEQGTAKTVMIKGYASKYDPEVHLTKALNFSSATTPNMFQRTVESYVDKRVGTTYGPPAGKKMTVFVDDINMPTINEWGDQITNEIVRQLLENKGFYSLDRPGDFTNIADIQLVAAMIHPGGGRNDIPQRLKRKFCIFNCTLPSNNSIDKIFSTIATGYFCKERKFLKPVIDLVEQLVPLTRVLWQKTKIKMLPTPAKFHYIFNLRDLSRVWQGILTVNNDTADSTETLLGLWKHECQRVVADRFTNQEDKDWFDEKMQEMAVEKLGEELAAQMPSETFFVDFLRDAPELTGEEPDDFEPEVPKVYEGVPSLAQMEERLKSFLEQYNETVRGGKMDLVFFKDAMVHLMRISRIIRTPRGNALLVGVGGSGKQSLTRLASFIAGYKIFQITLSRTYNATNLMDDLKVLYKIAGKDGQGVTFIFTDNEIKDEGFLEYMNNVLASGEVSNLFARDEIDEINMELIPVMKKEYPKRPPTPENLYDYFLSRARSNLHVVLCFSPVGEKFRARSLKFPGLFSGCTMDWFLRWPRQALIQVAQHFLSDYDVKCTPETKANMVQVMGTVQDLVSEKCVEYFERFRRSCHVTPKSYLSFITGYKNIYGIKLSEIGVLAERMKTGLDKLVEAQKSVNALSAELTIKEKDLAVASKEADEVLKVVTEKATAAEKVKAEVQKVKDKAQAIVDAINKDKGAAEAKLLAAKPALEKAEAALQTIKPADIATVRKLGKPPHLIMRIMDCVLVLMRRRLNPIEMDPERPCPKPSWNEALKLMNQSQFLSMLLHFSKDTITEEMVELLTPYLEMEDYNLETAKKVCGNVAGLCSWTEAMAYFYGINKEVLPLKANLAVQEAKLERAMVDLKTAQATLDEKQKQLDEVQAQYDKAMSHKQMLVEDAETCRRKMTNAMALIEGLGGEKTRWEAAGKKFQDQINRLVGDVLLATGFLSYSGPFNQDFRSLLVSQWKKEMAQNEIPFSEDINLITMLVDNATVGEWNLQGLPNDELSIQNGIIVTKATRYPLLIDPQGQGKIWIKNREKNSELQLTSLNHKYFRTHLEDALSLGRALIIEDVGEELDPALDNVLEQNFIKSGSTFKVKVGDKEVDVMKGFKLYITTKLSNPAYTPEIYARTSIIDFTVTMKGLEDQLLGRVILTEKQELEAERVALMTEVTANKRKMQELEDNLLYRLTSTKGSLVDDESLIAVLQNTKQTAEEVSEKLSIAAETELKINSAREEYRPVANRGSILYFLIVEMSLVNVMYQTSLRQFLGLFDQSLEKSAKSPIPAKRIYNIMDYLTFCVFKYTARGLYENHKFLYTLLLALKIDLNKGHLTYEEFQTFIKGGASLDLNTVEAKPKKWIQDMTWLNLVQLSRLPQFSQLLNQIGRNDRGWKTWFDEEAPEEAVIPDGYGSSLDTFRKLLLIRSWCPDRTIAQARHYISQSLGAKYAESVILDMEMMWMESDNRNPMVCFLSMGSDPTENIERLAKMKGIPCRAVSMGQGQEVHARRLLIQSFQDGGWLLLQNCHLGLDYMDELLENVTNTDSIHESYRTWITTEVHVKFPINLLQSSIKYTNEPPQGVKAGLKRTYGSITQEFLDISNMPQWKPVLYGVAFLHTTVQERRKFGPLGWNIPYEFNQSDYSASVQFVQNHLDDIDVKKGVSWNTVRYMFGEIQYGGRVTDDLDKILLNTYCKAWFGEHMFSDKFSFYTGYIIPKAKTIQEYHSYIDNLPLVDTPEVFGLHTNADITYQTNMANESLGTIVSIQPKESSGGAGETRESVVWKMADEMLEKLPDDFLPHEVKARLQKMGSIQPMNIFLRQEIDRMQRVITLVRIMLQDLKLAIDGTIIMSDNLRDALDQMYDARIPKAWQKISWESSTLGFWFTEFLERHEQFHTWLFEGRPNQFWMTGFFNPQGFLTAMRQEVTRAHSSKGWALDGVMLYNDVTKFLKEDITSPPPADIGGVYVYGLFLDGAGWDRRQVKLIEPLPKVIFTTMPVVHVYAINVNQPKDDKKLQGMQLYPCPVYKKPRRTDLTYIFSLLLRTSQPPDHWVLRGVAVLCDTK
ncbi:dynein axonemal heavy chain 5-like isoform X1 [Clavelina lepadiformis]|uniref:dynein axonemal heavy chain 5-like isoform X1 n=2 Tax=Clavelina lepadiformis TaxID=159417 RepID=UPI0040431F25